MKVGVGGAIKELIIPEFDALKAEIKEIIGGYEEIIVRVSDLNQHVIELDSKNR